MLEKTEYNTIFHTQCTFKTLGVSKLTQAFCEDSNSHSSPESLPSFEQSLSGVAPLELPVTFPEVSLAGWSFIFPEAGQELNGGVFTSH